jgi:hypothetical protein
MKDLGAASIRALVGHAPVEIELDRHADVLVVYGLGDLGISRHIRVARLVPLSVERREHFAAGAVRKVVGIRCGAFSGNMKVSFQAARSIG